MLLLGSALTSTPASADPYAIFRSDNGGQSWIRSDAGMPAQSRINAFGSAEGAFFAGTDSGIFWSRDDAHSWQPAQGAGSTARILCFAHLGRKVFAGTDSKGMLMSLDGGRSWVRNATFPPQKPRCLLSFHGRIYAGTDAGGVVSSGDDGQTWIALAAGFPAGAQVFSMTEVEGILFAGLYNRGLIAWDGQKQSWSQVRGVQPLALASAGGVLIAGHNPGGLYWSRDLGVTWSKGTPAVDTANRLGLALAGDSGELLADAPIWEMASSGSMVFAGASSGIYLSDDLGQHWTRARKGLPPESPGIAFLVRRELILAAAPIQGNKGERGGPANGSQPFSSQ
jgi:photosystem II stability/assembly factor-like uncharacterized protein